MIVLTAILPIVILGFFALFFFFTIKVGKKYMTIKVTHWLLFIYIAVLVLATVFVPFLTEKSAGLERVEQEASDQRMGDYYTKLNDGDIDEIDPNYLIQETRFDDYQNQTVEIVTQTQYAPQVFVEGKTSDDSQIEAYVYSGGLVVNGFDFSDILKPHQIELEENILTITPIQQEINLTIGSDSFPVRQFTGETLFRNHSFSSGDSMVYLRIPQDIEIKSDNVHLVYIER
jgi:energy-coupling factor transporter transmembrane protein EcfT